jgi:acetyltransferase-like isoleucine patch superfamily enzyme
MSVGTISRPSSSAQVTGRRTISAYGSRSFLGLYRGTLLLRDKVFSVLVRGSFASYGSRSVLQLPIRLTGEGRIAIGSGVFIGSGSWLQVLGGEGQVALSIGDGTSVSGNCVLSAAQSIRLGKKVLLARNVYIADHMHAFDDRTRAVLDQGITRVAPVEIGDGAWLGQNVVVGPGVRVGKGAVVGANSVVLEDVPDFEVAVGAPARVLVSSREAVGADA